MVEGARLESEYGSKAHRGFESLPLRHELSLEGSLLHDADNQGLNLPVMSSAPDREEGLPSPRRYWAAAAIWLAIFTAVLDSAIANVALPSIGRALGASPASSIWIVNAYQVTITVLLLPLAALGDKIGYRRVYLPSLLLFVVGSGLCALSGSFGMLITARVVQGCGAAGIMSMNAALLRAIYPAEKLGRGIGYNAMVLSVSAATGPTLAALILSVGPWPWLFLINLPIGVAAFVLALRALPDRRGHEGAFDWLSALLSGAALGLITFGAETAARAGAAAGLPLVGVGLIAGAVLVRREWHDPAPLVPLDLLRIPVMRLSIATSVVSFAAQMLAYLSLPFMLQASLGRSVVETGLLMTPWPIAVGLTAPIAGRLADRHPAGLLGGIGLALFAVGLFALSRLAAEPSNVDIVWRMALCGMGFGFFQSPNNRTILVAAPRPRSGAAGGLLATARLLGQTGGAVAVAGAFHIAGVRASSGLLTAAALTAAIAAGLSLLRLRTGSPSRAGAGSAIS